MAWNRPTLQELVQRAEADLQGRLFGSSVPLRRSFVSILARVWAGMCHLQHGFLQYIAKQIFPSTADSESLERHGLGYGIQRQAATFAAGYLNFTGTPGVILPAGTVLQRPDGEFYTVQNATQIATTGAAQALVQAERAGQAANASQGTVLEITTPVAGIAGTAAAVTEIAGGADTETDAALRARILERMQRPPMGGAAHDYESWATELPGITGASVFPLAFGAGTVLVVLGNYANANPQLDAAKLAEANAYIQQKRPVTAAVTVATVQPVRIDIDLKLNPSTPAVQQAVLAELGDLFKRQGRPGKTISRAQLDEAISAAAGEIDHRIDGIYQDFNPVDSITLGLYGAALVGTVYFSGLQ